MKFKLNKFMRLDPESPPAKKIRLVDASSLILLKNDGNLSTARARAEKDAIIQAWEPTTDVLLWARPTAFHMNVYELTPKDVKAFYK